MRPPPQGTEGVAPHDGEVEAAISTGIVQLVRRYTGRGPTHARTTIGTDVVVCVLAATLTKGEQTLVDHEQQDVVLSARRAYQELMKPQAVQLVEQITGRAVVAFMSANHVVPDLAAEIFILRPLARQPT
jgi:uncharacterized protein YbcI